jgi:hypothetical protein
MADQSAHWKIRESVSDDADESNEFEGYQREADAPAAAFVDDRDDPGAQTKEDEHERQDQQFAGCESDEKEH